MTTTAPEFLPRDTYAGRHTVNANRKSGVFTVAELAAMADPKTGIVVLWEFSGHVWGKPLFARSRFAVRADGGLDGYDSDGAKKFGHPAGRKIRIMTR